MNTIKFTFDISFTSIGHIVGGKLIVEDMATKQKKVIGSWSGAANYVSRYLQYIQAELFSRGLK